MKKLEWQRKYLYNGRTPHTLFPHDYSSNSNLWIQKELKHMNRPLMKEMKKESRQVIK